MPARTTKPSHTQPNVLDQAPPARYMTRYVSRNASATALSAARDLPSKRGHAVSSAAKSSSCSRTGCPPSRMRRTDPGAHPNADSTTANVSAEKLARAPRSRSDSVLTPTPERAAKSANVR